MSAKYDYDLAILNEKTKYTVKKLEDLNSTYNDLQIRQEDFLRNGKSNEETNLLKERYETLQKNYSKTKDKLDDNIIKLNQSESKLSKSELEQNAEIKRLHDKNTDLTKSNDELKTTYKLQIDK